MIKTCLFPAAGYGTRFLPATKAVPKEMLPILTKPLLQYGVEEALSAKIKNMAIVTGRGKRSIEDHFDDSFELESQLRGTTKEHLLNEINQVIDCATFTYVRQRKMLGLGDAILTGQPLIGEEPFAVILADDLIDTEGDSVSIVVNSSIFVLKTLFFSFFQFILAGMNNGIFRCILLVNKPYLDCFAVNMF